MNETVGIGGAESLILHMAKELRDRGNRVVCILPSKDKWLNRELVAEDIPIRHFHLTSPFDLACTDDLTAKLRADGVTAIHSHEFAMAVYGTVVAHRLRCPHVITLHGNQRMLDRFRRRVALRWAIRNSTATVAVSRSTRNHLTERLRLSANEVTVIPNGIPHPHGNRKRSRRGLGVRSSSLVVLAVGSLVERKGFHVLVEALGRLNQQGVLPEDVHLFIAGEGSFRPEIEAKIQEYSLQDRVTMLGYRLDIADLQAAADIFVMPSLWEGLPLAVLEAMFAENPIVATRTSGIPEAITNESEGLLVDPGDSASLAAALQRLFRDPTLRRRLAVGAHDRALAEFTVERMVDRYEARFGFTQPI